MTDEPKFGDIYIDKIDGEILFVIVNADNQSTCLTLVWPDHYLSVLPIAQRTLSDMFWRKEE